jgi:hypothetical protein
MGRDHVARMVRKLRVGTSFDLAEKIQHHFCRTRVCLRMLPEVTTKMEESVKAFFDRYQEFFRKALADGSSMRSPHGRKCALVVVGHRFDRPLSTEKLPCRAPIPKSSKAPIGTAAEHG